MHDNDDDDKIKDKKMHRTKHRCHETVRIDSVSAEVNPGIIYREEK